MSSDYESDEFVEVDSVKAFFPFEVFDAAVKYEVGVFGVFRSLESGDRVLVYDGLRVRGPVFDDEADDFFVEGDDGEWVLRGLEGEERVRSLGSFVEEFDAEVEWESPVFAVPSEYGRVR